MGTRLRNKVAIVTGGGAGIGEAICKKFALEGAKIVVCGLSDDPVQEVASQIEANGGVAIPFQGDISQAPNARACVQLAVDTFGKLDILINNAGVFPAVGYINEYPIDALEYMLQNNIQSTFMMTKFAVPFLQKTKGCIVCAGSEAGIDGDAQNAPYSGTKGYIHAFTRAVAAEQAQFGVRANVVCPGPIDTAWTRSETSPMTPKMEKLFLSATPMGRRGTPEEVANVYLFLASDEASYVTGALYTVDGGITISKGPIGLMADSEMKKAPEGELELEFSHEGNTVRRPFQEMRSGDLYEEELRTSDQSATLRNTLIGLSLAAVGVLATRFFSNSSTKSQTNTMDNRNQNREEQNQREGARDESQLNALHTNAEAQKGAQPQGQTDEAKTGKAQMGAATGTGPSTNVSVGGQSGQAGQPEGNADQDNQPNGNDKGFTNEAATGNND